MSSTNANTVLPTEIMWSMVAQLTSDIADLFDCEWAIATDCIGNELVPFYTVGRNPNLQACLTEMHSALSGQVAGVDLSVTPVVVRDAHCDAWMARVLFLIRVHDQIVALVALGAAKTSDPYTDHDQAFITTHLDNFSFLLRDGRLARRIGTQIARAHRTSRELETAREVQQRLLPCKLPRIDGLDYYGDSQAVGELGGDFFDFIRISESSLLLSIGDVSGKGVSSAIMMAAVQGSLRALGSCMDFDICALMHNLNRMLWELAPDNFFATMFCARIDVGRREMHYVNAGHDRAILFAAGHRQPTVLESTGTVLGLSTRTLFERHKVRFGPGDTLLAVTDGIIEAGGLDQSVWARAFSDGARERTHNSARDLAEDIIQMAQLQSDSNEAPPDDKTVVVVRRVKDSASSFVPVPMRPRVLAHAAGL
jgi:hypothetical protein